MVKVCPTCGNSFETSRSERVYCSRICRITRPGSKFLEKDKAASGVESNADSIAKIALAASKLNMSYGNYLQAVAAGRIKMN